MCMFMCDYIYIYIYIICELLCVGSQDASAEEHEHSGQAAVLLFLLHHRLVQTPLPLVGVVIQQEAAYYTR